MQTQFDTETRGDISNEIARWMGLDGQDAHRTERSKVHGIDVRFVNDSERETQISEFAGDEINGPNAGLDSIVRMIESAVLRDAASRTGDALYALYFHLAGGQMNRGRFPFYVPGGAHMHRGSGRGSALARRDDYGGGMDGTMAGDALRVSVEFLKWSTDERRVNDERSELLFRTVQDVMKSQQEILKSQQAVLEEGFKRDLRVRELEADMLDHKYELDKKRKADDERERWVGKAIEAAETYGPMLLPPVVELIRKFNGGPNYVPQEMNIDNIQEQIRHAKEAAAATAAAGHGDQNGSSNGHGSNGQNGNGNGHTPAPQQQQPPPSGEGEPSPLEIFHHRIAFDLVRLVALVKAGKGLPAMRESLAGSPQAQQIFDMIVEATGKPAVGATEESINELSQLALTFGGTLLQTPLVGLQLASTLDGFERAALIEFSDLLKRYAEFVEQVAASQRAQQQQGVPASPP